METSATLRHLDVSEWNRMTTPPSPSGGCSDDEIVNPQVLNVNPLIGVAQTVFLVDRVFVPCQEGSVST